MPKWWLISDEDVQEVRTGLMAATHEASDCLCWHIQCESCAGCEGDELRCQALHSLESGLHETDAVPADFQEVKDVPL